jgi:hypothetical protein
MLECAIFDQRPLWNLLVVARQAHHEAEIDFRVRIQVCCAQLDDVAQAFRLAMLAHHAVIVVDAKRVSLIIRSI